MTQTKRHRRKTVDEVNVIEIVNCLDVFIKSVRGWWKKIEEGELPDKKDARGWIESCDFASIDIKKLRRVFKRMIKLNQRNL